MTELQDPPVDLDMPLGEMMSTRADPLEYVDVMGKVWQEFPGWEPGDPWQDRWIMPEDEGYQTIGWQAIDWLHQYVQSPNGDGPCRLTPEQQRFLLHWYSFDPATEMPRYRTAVFVRPKGPVCDDEQVPTPQGFVRHGDLKVGDEVYASDGSITTVTAVIDSGVEDESCLVEFSDGAPIAVSLDHRIPVDEFGGSGRARTVATPREMLEKGITFERKLTKGKTKATKGGVSRYRALRSPAREGREADFVIDPYVLGYWLGDGDKDTPRITCHEGELGWLREEFASRGMEPRPAQNTHGETYRFRFGNGVAQVELRRLGVLGDKHIPEEYMRASFDQRLDLLRGIVDSDGHVDKRGYVEVALRSDDRLAQDVVELCRSLGLHPKVTYSETSFKGKKYSPRARIKFVPIDFHCALLPRKREREVKVGKSTGIAPFSRSRVVTGITPLGRRPVSCVEVAHPSHEYLVGENAIPVCNSGKDPLAAMICILEFVGPCRLLGWDADGEPVAGAHPNPLVQLAAVSKEQNANTVSLFPVMMNQEFQDLFDVQLGVDVSYAHKRKCTLKALTSNFRTQEGARPSCVIENEVHHWLASQGGTDFHAVLGRNLTKRGYADPWARRLCITNAYKPSEESVARNIRETIEDAMEGRAVDTESILYDSIEVRADVSLRPPEEFCSEVDSEGKPIPSVEDRTQLLMRLLREVRGDAFWLNLRQTATEILSNPYELSDMRRFYLNQVTAAEEAWLDRKDIKAAIHKDVAKSRLNADHGLKSFEVGWMPVSASDPVVLFFDGSKSDDATGIVGCRVSDGYVFTVGVWQRPTNLTDEEKLKWRVDRAEVDARLRQAMRRFRVVAFWGDPSHAKDEVDYTPYWDELLDEWHRDFSDRLELWAVNSQQQGVHAIMWDMTSPARTAQFVAAAQKTVEDFESLDITIDGHPALVAHLTNAQEREDEKNGITLGKESRYSQRKIDLAVCLVGARMLRRLVKLAGLEESQGGTFWGS